MNNRVGMKQKTEEILKRKCFYLCNFRLAGEDLNQDHRKLFLDVKVYFLFILVTPH